MAQPQQIPYESGFETFQNWIDVVVGEFEKKLNGIANLNVPQSLASFRPAAFIHMALCLLRRAGSEDADHSPGDHTDFAGLPQKLRNSLSN